MAEHRSDTTYILRGRVLDAGSRQPVPEIRVEAYDYDFGKSADERLGGNVITAQDGSFEITFRRREAGEQRSEREPEAYLVFYTSDGKQFLRQSGWVRLTGAEHDYGTVELPASVVTSSAGVADDQSENTNVSVDTRVGPGEAPKVRDPSDPAGSAKFHGSKTRPFVAPRSPFPHGPFGRLFRELAPWTPPGGSDEEKTQCIAQIAGLMLEPEGADGTSEGDNPSIPAGYTYFGQFVDHDITFDPGSSLQKQNDPERLQNFRTPCFDLDNLYGGGPDDAPFLFSRRANCRGRFLIGKGRHVGGPDEQIDMGSSGKTQEEDLPRNEQGIALVGDPRNDENLIVAQLQLAFLKFHNRVMDHVEQVEQLTGREAFDRARTLVRWHYQWVVLHDYLVRISGKEVVDQVLVRQTQESGDGAALGPPNTFNLRFFKWKNQPYMPVEFSVAAYRFGHSMIRARYDLNGFVRGVPIFQPPSLQPGSLSDLRGFRPLPGMWSLEWSRYFVMNGSNPQKSRRINAQLSRALAKIPAGPGGENALAFLNLLRGWRMELPSGQAVARAMGAAHVYSNDELGLGSNVGDFGSEAPLWYYLLKEAEIETQGQHLGPVGGRIVAEVFVGLAKGDPNCFLNVDPRWSPERATKGGPLIQPQGEQLELGDIIRFATMEPSRCS